MANNCDSIITDQGFKLNCVEIIEIGLGLFDVNAYYINDVGTNVFAAGFNMNNNGNPAAIPASSFGLIDSTEALYNQSKVKYTPLSFFGGAIPIGSIYTVTATTYDGTFAIIDTTTIDVVIGEVCGFVTEQDVLDICCPRKGHTFAGGIKGMASNRVADARILDLFKQKYGS